MLFRRAGLTVAATDHPPGRGWPRELPYYLREAAAFVINLIRLAVERRSRGIQ